MNTKKHYVLILGAIVSSVNVLDSNAMAGAKQVFSKVSMWGKMPLIASTRSYTTLTEHHNLNIERKKGEVQTALLNGINYAHVLKKEQRQKLKKSALWGFSAFNGFLYSLGFALNPEILQPFMQTSTGLVAASACFTALATYNAKQYFNEKKVVDAHINKVRDHIKVV